MKKFALVMAALMLVLALGTASASIYGGIQERADLAEANKGPGQASGDVGGVFTASLNATQPLYAAVGITDFFSLAEYSTGNASWTATGSST